MHKQQQKMAAPRWSYMKKNKIDADFAGLLKLNPQILCLPLANVQAQSDLCTFNVSAAGLI
jgi:hypothetical protein